MKLLLFTKHGSLIKAALVPDDIIITPEQQEKLAYEDTILVSICDIEFINQEQLSSFIQKVLTEERSLEQFHHALIRKLQFKYFGL